MGVTTGKVAVPTVAPPPALRCPHPKAAALSCIPGFPWEVWPHDFRLLLGPDPPLAWALALGHWVPSPRVALGQVLNLYIE